jgi:hypothetical protein
MESSRDPATLGDKTAAFSPGPRADASMQNPRSGRMLD